MIRSLGIVATPRFGAFLESLIKKLMPMLQIKTTLAEAATCDVVVIAVPLKEFEKTLTELMSLMKKDAIFIEMGAVKAYTTPILKRLAEGRQYMSLQPMSGPQSYEKHPDIEKLRVIITEQTLPGAMYLGVLAFFKQWGIKIIGMTPEAHDEYLARSLFCTHFPQQAEEDGLAVAEHDTIYFGDLIDPEEAYRLNPACEIMRRRLGIPESDVQALLKV